MKQELKPGDRVRVEFEAAVSNYHRPDDAWVLVEVKDGIDDTVSEDAYLPIEYCTLIEPEIVLPEIPGTIVQVDPLNEHHQRAVYEFDRFPEGDWWRFGYRDALNTHELIEECRQYGYRVIPAATEEVESV